VSDGDILKNFSILHNFPILIPLDTSTPTLRVLPVFPSKDTTLASLVSLEQSRINGGVEGARSPQSIEYWIRPGLEGSASAL
jgi:hypothetical protein